MTSGNQGEPAERGGEAAIGIRDDVDATDVATRAAKSPSVLVFGLNDRVRTWLEAANGPGVYRYVPAVEGVDTVDPTQDSADEVIADVVAKARRIPDLAGIVALDDYPESLLASAVAEELGLPGPKLSSLLLLHHKVWSRAIQREAAPRAVPRFRPIDLNGSYRPADIGFDFPIFVKPVKASLSYLGFRCGTMSDFESARNVARGELPAYARMMNDLIRRSRVEPPKDYVDWAADAMIAEEYLSGRQCTLEGYMVRGEMHVLGIVDSIRLPNRISFTRFQMPTAWPSWAQRDMVQISERVLRRAEFDNGLFNVEFFLDPRRRRPMLIEVNPRLCVQFSDFYAKIHGLDSLRALVDIAIGRAPPFRPHHGHCRVAASFVLRSMRDRRALRAPTPDDVAAIEASIPDCRIDVLTVAGERLSDRVQDAYTFRYALINVAAANDVELRQRFAAIRERLRFEWASE
jgi:biotin carboxylase